MGGIVLVGLAAVWLVADRRHRRDFAALTTSPTAQVRTALPEGTFAFRVADAPAIEAPFVRQRRPAAEGVGDILVFPDRGGADNNRGKASFVFNVERPGPCEAWIRARWENQCGNSVLFEANGSHGYTAGQDAVYDTWHWVRAGRHVLVAGTNRVSLVGREDGIALDEILLTPSPTFVPHAAALAAGPARDLRQVADDFDRSPGHGLAPWQAVSGQWDIAFTLDPNRIPNQYALTGRPGTNADAVAVLQADPWDGVRLVFSFSPVAAGEAGALVARGADGRQATAVLFNVTSNTATLRVEGPAGVETRDLGDRVRLGQWHRVAIERWAWVVRVAVDDVPVFTSARMDPAGGALAFCVRSGAAVFDDASAAEIPWQAEGGDHLSIPWSVDEGAQWERVRAARGGGLAGWRGEIRTGLGGVPVRAVLVEDDGSAVCRMNGVDLAETVCGNGGRLLDAVAGVGPADTVSLAPGSAGHASIKRVAVAYGANAPEVYVDGPYHFTSPVIDDPSDYLDFTPEEYRQTVASAEAGKLQRELKTFPVVGRRTDGSVWAIEDGRWFVSAGALVGTSPGTLHYWRDTYVSLEMRARVNLAAPVSTAAVDLFTGLGPGLRARLGPALGPGAASATNTVALDVPADGVWHDVRVRVDGDRLEGAVDGGKPAAAVTRRSPGGAIQLAAISGSVRFDDIRFIVPRAGRGEFLYAFDRRETDWWREGGAWIDHGGIACALASHWISLVAPAGRGVLWNKRTFGPDLLVAATIEENTEWFGWRERPSHTHHPYDNICILLAPEANWDAGYRLEVNARGRSATVLYRAGEAVKTVPQDYSFPMRYHGGHQPYEPRRNHVALMHTGAKIRAFVNGVQVLTYEDRAPLRVARVGIGGYDTYANFSRIEIRELR